MVEKAYPIKIGLEVHGYLDTREKLFCMCRVSEGRSSVVGGSENKVNDRVCPICTGQPGSKPMAVNGEAVRKVVQIASIFKSKINSSGLIWQRKHYSWADLPKGYQTTLSVPHALRSANGGKFNGSNITAMNFDEDSAQVNHETCRTEYNVSV